MADRKEFDNKSSHIINNNSEVGPEPSLSKDFSRAKLVRERQNEERLRKLEDLKQHALATQKFQEQREEERSRRIEELKSKYEQRRNQVEERRRQMWEAVQKKRESIMRKHEERNARIDHKIKNERSQVIFAFGSSTPRMLEPVESGNYWGTRRATSTTNVMLVSATPSLTRRSSERELDGSKKRATSAGGGLRKNGADMRMSSSMYEVFNWTEGEDRKDNGSTSAGPANRHRAYRRRTDLTPTLPSPRENLNTSFSGSLTSSMISERSSSIKSFPRSTGHQRSGDVTPSSPSRPLSSMSQQSNLNDVTMRPRFSNTKRPRPASIAGTGMNLMSSSAYAVLPSAPDRLQKDSKPPLPKVHGTGTSLNRRYTTGNPQSSRSARASPKITPRGTPLQSPTVEQSPAITKSAITPSKPYEATVPLTPSSEIRTNIIREVECKSSTKKSENSTVEEGLVSKNVSMQENVKEQVASKEASRDNKINETSISTSPITPQNEKDFQKNKMEVSDSKNQESLDEVFDMTASMIQKIRITTEEEAKAAIAERRKSAREQAEREADLEKQRLEQEARLEAERLRLEEEQQRRMEEESIRLAEEAKAAEEQRLQLAIDEVRRREEEENKRREEEARIKREKEESEKRAREEAEKQRLEMVERLRKEEEERNARRKRVEAIMSRTRTKNQTNPTNKETIDGEKPKEVLGEEIKTAAESPNFNAPIMDQRKEMNDENLTYHGEKRIQSNGIVETQTNMQIEELISNQNNENDAQKSTSENSNMKQNNVTNNLHDNSDSQRLSSSNTNTDPILLISEDNINSNLDPSAMSFDPLLQVNVTDANPFLDGFVNTKVEDNKVSGTYFV